MNFRERLKLWGPRLGRGYKATALIIFNTLLLIGLLNLICWLVLRPGNPTPSAAQYRQITGSLSKLYPELSDAQWSEFMKNADLSKFVFEPFTHFRNADHSSTYFNIRDGIRHPEEGAWPPRKDDFVVFVFGGSTTFGPVPDFMTIPARLQVQLRQYRGNVTVYNFGRLFYYSTQERVLFEQLLLKGRVPKVAIFIDGLNDFWHVGIEVPHAERFQQVFEPHTEWPKLPVVEACQSLVGSNRKPPENFDQSDEALRGVIERYLTNKRMIEAVATAFGVTPVFIWQPVPTYKFSSPYYPFQDWQLGRHACSRRGYALMDEVRSKADLGPRFLWLADLHQGFTQPMYIDQVHYSPPFSTEIAKALASFLVQRKIVPPPDSK